MAPRKLIDTLQERYVFQIYQGITFSRVFTYADVNDEPVNLTGKILSLKIKNVFPTELQVFSNGSPTTLGSTIAITDAANGLFRIKLTADETATAILGRGGKWWIEFYDGDDQDLLWIDDVIVLDV